MPQYFPPAREPAAVGLKTPGFALCAGMASFSYSAQLKQDAKNREAAGSAHLLGIPAHPADHAPEASAAFQDPVFPCHGLYAANIYGNMAAFMEIWLGSLGNLDKMGPLVELFHAVKAGWFG